MNFINNVNDEYSKYLLVLERLDQPLTTVPSDDDDDIVLEGTAAIFGITNENNRVYEKAEYLPHLEYLKEKIKQKRLFGELDHPQRFDIAFANVSHVIESLDYDPSSNSVKIRVRLLDTPSGKIAKSIVKAGYTVSISSRAAGNVDQQSSKVKLHRIFTYDLVVDPGFSQAGLSKVAESLSLTPIFESLELSRKSSVLSGLTDISEQFGFGDNVSVYKINNQTDIEINNTNQNNSKQQMATEYVTKKEMNQYTKMVQSKFSDLKQNMARNTKTLEKINEAASLADSSVNSKLVEYVNYLSEELQSVREYSNYLAEMIKHGIGYTEHVAEKVNNTIEYSDYLHKNINDNIRYSKYLGEKLNQTANYGEYLAENLNKSILYTQYVAEQADRGIQYAEYVGENANYGFKYSNYLAESLENAIKYSNYLGTNLEKGIKYTEYLAESMNSELGKGSVSRIKSILDEANSINESYNVTINENDSIETIVEAVDSIVNHIKSNSANAVLENKYPFLKLLSPNRKQAFYNLSQTDKTAIVETMSGAVYFTEDEVVSLMEAVLNKQNENIPTYIRFMPAKYKEIYESMTDTERNWIASQASLLQLNTQYQVKSFWDSRDLRGINERIAYEANINKNTINENQGKEGYVSLESVNDHLRGYSSIYLDSLRRNAKN